MLMHYCSAVRLQRCLVVWHTRISRRRHSVLDDEDTTCSDRSGRRPDQALGAETLQEGVKKTPGEKSS